jgi:hypothetical protein
MDSFYLNVWGQALTLATLVTVIFGGSCWLIEAVVGRRVGVYVGYAAIAAVMIVFAHEVRASLECLGASSSWCNPHDWLAYNRANAAALALITIPLLAISEIKLRRWSLNRAPLTH